MWRTSVLALVLAFGAAGPAGAQLSAEHFFRKGTVSLTVTAGGAAFSDFQRAVEQPDTGSQRFERRLSAGTTGVIGAELVWWLGSAWGLRAHASYMPSRFAVKHDREGEEWLREQSVTAQGPTYERLRIWAADVSALVRPPFNFRRVAPYGILGAGIVSYRPQSSRALPPEAEAAFTGGARTSPAAVVGVGAILPLQKGDMLLSFALTDHITRTPVTEANATTAWRDSRNGSSLYPSEDEGGVRFTSNVRLMVGLTIPLRSR
jgi:hypothetical protein